MDDEAPLTPRGIAAVERDTGLTKDTLRVWERRYGFPAPGRAGSGERAYTRDEVDKLRLMKRLVDGGHRPGRLAALALEQLQQLAGEGTACPERFDPSRHLALVRAHDARALRSALRQQMLQIGIGTFVAEVVAPLNIAVGDAWLKGRIEVYEEHLYTEAVQAVLRQGLALLPDPAPAARPRVLLTTLPGEAHGLGLLMAEAVLAQAGADCLPLGLQTPLWDIVLAARVQPADVVALGFGGSTGPNQIVSALADLRSRLAPGVEIWAGGSVPVLRRRRIDGVLPFATMAEVAPALERWRAAAGAAPLTRD